MLYRNNSVTLLPTEKRVNKNESADVVAHHRAVKKVDLTLSDSESDN